MLPEINTVLAFDYGQRRIGLAIGQSITGTATALTTLTWDKQLPWGQIEHQIREWRPQLLVVGLPLHADGTDSDFSAEIRNFAAALQQRFSIPVKLHNEHLSSAAAQSQLRAQRQSGERKRKISKSDIDAAAAALILESWFAKKENWNQKTGARSQESED
ncbi:MAG TPA: Holliday junction resolvase RuvX [Gammaproteobacteria bacterium]